MSKNKILFISSLCSDEQYALLQKNRLKKVLDPSQRLFKSFVEGMSKYADVTCLTALPVSPSISDKNKYEYTEEYNNGIEFCYLAFRNAKFKRVFDLNKGAREFVSKWISLNSDYNSVVICDSLILMCSHVARVLSQKKNIPVIAFVTDYPSFATSIKKRKERIIKKIIQKAFDRCADKDLNKYDSYILVSKYLSELIPKSKNNYLLIEDIAPPYLYEKTSDYSNHFEIVYGGALCERFGINKLVDAVLKTNNPSIRMNFYGSGESVGYIETASKKDTRIKYCGVVDFKEMMIIQSKSKLLINPRPSFEIFSKYSFPSKTLSYILSGTPLLSTRIPGIPEDYREYIYWIDDESVQGIASKIEELSRVPEGDLYAFGKRAREYAMTHKTSSFQCQRIYNFFLEKGFFTHD